MNQTLAKMRFLMLWQQQLLPIDHNMLAAFRISHDSLYSLR